MADNVNLTAGDGTIVAGTDTIGGVAYPRAKVVWGPDGTVNDTDVATGKPLPVQLRTATGTAFDTGVGTGGSGTPRVAIDSSQIPTAGQAVAGSSVPTVQAGFPYESVAASATDQVIGGSGATGDYLSHVVVVPAVAACGLVTIKDNTTAIISFVGGGTTAMPSVAPFVIPVGMLSANGAWKITTGANVSCVAVGRFT